MNHVGDKLAYPLFLFSKLLLNFMTRNKIAHLTLKIVN